MYQFCRKIFPTLCFLAVGLVAASCGSEQHASGGIGGTGISSGTVTGFGSVFVNGVRFDTAGATRLVDDVMTVSNGTDDITVMAQGMVVTINGTVNADGVTGVATSVEFDEIVEGPISANPVEDMDMVTKTFTVFGIPVVVNVDATVFVGTDYASLSKDDIAEISGFFDAAGNLRATHLVKEGVLTPGTVVEMHGVVSGFNGVDTFMLGAVTVIFNGATVFEGLPGSVTNGQFVEASGTLSGTSTINAARLELEQNSFSDTTSISLEGIVTQFNGVGDFVVQGAQVNAASAIFTPPTFLGSIANDVRVEVTGALSGGVLTASEVESRGGDLKLSGQVTAVDPVNGTVTVEVVMGQPAIIVTIDTKTQMEDELLQVKPFTLNDLALGDEVIVEGISGNGGTAIASQLKRKLLQKYVLEGTIDSASGNSLAGSVTVLGVTFSTDNSTEFEDMNDQPFPNGGDDFYNQVTPGDGVEIEDDKPVDGIADEVELKS